MPYLPITRCFWKAYTDGRLALRTIDYLLGWNEVVIDKSNDIEHRGECWVSVELVPPGKNCRDTYEFYAKSYTEAMEKAKPFIRKDVEIVEENPTKLKVIIAYLEAHLHSATK